jgi:outer membrane protein assembly factor BamB
MFGTFFDSRFGLFVYTPVYLLVAVGIIAMFRTGRSSDKRLLLWMALLTVPYMLFIFTYEAWHGVWNPPARYLATFVALAAAPLAMALFVMTRNWITGIIYSLVYAIFSIPGWITTFVMLNDARVMWPLSLSPTYDWLAQDKAPVFPNLPAIFSLPFTIKVQEYLINFLKPDEVAHPFLSARAIVASVLVVFVLVVLMFVPRIMRSGRRWSLPMHGMAWMGVFGLLALGWYGMNDNYLKHKTLVTLDQSWLLPMHLEEPYGIAYLGGKVYLSSFNRGSTGFVGALDLATGGMEVIQPTVDGHPVAFAHPSDIKVGPGGFLYVLNNGEGHDALWVMKPNGEIVSQLTLNGKTPIATGLNIGPDGKIYVGDMLGGKIDVWNKDGGDFIAAYGGPSGGLNNPSGVAVSPNGNVFALENGNGLIYEIAPNGETVRRYNPECRPIHGTTVGDWIDISCENGLVSINTKNNNLQFSHFGPPEAIKPESFRGLTYGPNDTLYMLDFNSGTLYSYKISH